MTSHESNKLKSCVDLSEMKKNLEENNLTTVTTNPKALIQEFLCKEEHGKLFEELWNGQQMLGAFHERTKK